MSDEQKILEKRVYGSGPTADWGDAKPRRDRKKSKRTRSVEKRIKRSVRNGAKDKIERQASKDGES